MRTEKGAATVSPTGFMSNISSQSSSLKAKPMTAPTARRRYDEAELQQITAEILRNNGITVPPVPVHRILKKLGVHFQSVEFVDPTHQKRLIAFTKREGEQFTISTNAELSVEEQQFGVAREFGRYCLQKETIRTFACTYMDNLLLPEKTPSARELRLREPLQPYVFTKNELGVNVRLINLTMPLK